MSTRTQSWFGVGLAGTHDPTVLIPGDPDALRGDGCALDAMAETLAMVADVVGGVDLGGWTGHAATAFAETTATLRTRVLVAATAMAGAATALQAHATALEWAQDRARTAIRLYDASAGCTAPDVFGVSPLTAGQDRAVAILGEARAATNTSAAAATAAIEDACSGAPIGPGFWNEVGYLWSELWHGAEESFVGIGELAWNVSTIRLLVDHDGWLASNTELGSGLLAAAKDPVQLGKDVIDYDTWASSPARAVGHFAPDALIAILTAGGGVAATRAASAGEKVVVDAARTSEKVADAARAGERTAMGARVAEALAGAAPKSAMQVLAETKAAMFARLAARADFPQYVRRMFEGSRFNWENYGKYSAREVAVDRLLATDNAPRRFILDSYSPGEAVVSRKYTQLADVQESTAKGYIKEMVSHYDPRSSEFTIADTPMNQAQLGHIDGAIGGPVRGPLVLEIPVQTQAIPRAVLEYAAEADVRIQDIAGTVYRLGPGGAP
jgi:hypothetical protein